MDEIDHTDNGPEDAGVEKQLDETERSAACRFRAVELDRHIGDRLRFVRRLSCLSQRQVADEIGLSFQQVQKYENGSNRVSAALLAEFSGLYHLPMDWFIGPFNTCLEREERAHHGDYAEVLNQLYRALRDRSDSECDAALDLACQIAGVGAGPRQTRLFRLWRTTRDGSSKSNEFLLEVMRRLTDAQSPPPATPDDQALEASVVEETLGNRNVLLVDDDPDVLTMLSASMAGAGFAVITARSGDEALNVLTSGTEVDVIVTDYAMVGMDGVELLAQAASLRPGLPGIVITGFADAARLRELPPEVEVLSKPFRRMELIGRVRLLMEGSSPNPDPVPRRQSLRLVK